MKHKTAQAMTVKDADAGEVEVVFSTLNVIDKHGDVTRPGAFQREEVLISAYGHESWYGKLPVGKGAIEERGDEGVFRGKFFMDTTHGRDTFTTVKNTGSLQQWSYGYDILEASHGEQENQRVQYLDKLKVWEVSPVLIGAGENTRTLTAKGALPDNLKFDQHIAAVVTAVDELIDRASSVVTLRTEAGKSAIAPARASDLADLQDTIKRLGDLLTATDAPEADVLAALELEAELTRATALLN